VRKRLRPKRRRGERRPSGMAAAADKYVLYQISVQEPSCDVEFMATEFATIVGRAPRTLREDFCGTALTACEWVRTIPGGEAWGVDVDKHVLEWAMTHNLGKLDTAHRGRVHLVESNVMDVRTTKTVQLVDIVAAMNFSWCCFKTRPTLLGYFREVQKALVDGGIFALDIFGGPDAQAVGEERTEKEGGFVYVWDQDTYDALSNEIVCHIHFEFPDGTKMKKAFTYDWRLWTVQEVRELLEEAGFSRSIAHWEQEDEDGDFNGVHLPQEHAENEEAWVTYGIGGK